MIAPETRAELLRLRERRAQAEHEFRLCFGPGNQASRPQIDAARDSVTAAILAYAAAFDRHGGPLLDALAAAEAREARLREALKLAEPVVTHFAETVPEPHAGAWVSEVFRPLPPDEIEALPVPDAEPTEADERHIIAAVIDHPSVYMGGPSHRALRLADRILYELRATRGQG